PDCLHPAHSPTPHSALPLHDALPILVNPDQWDGYPEERRWLYDLLKRAPGGGSSRADDLGEAGGPDAANPADVAVLSGDLHSSRSEEHTSELQSLRQLVCRVLLEKKK